MGKQIPIVGYLALDDGPPHLVAWEAVGSGALYFDRRNADANQGGTEFKRRKLSNTGKLRSFTIVGEGQPGERPITCAAKPATVRSKGPRSASRT